MLLIEKRRKVLNKKRVDICTSCILLKLQEFYSPGTVIIFHGSANADGTNGGTA